jgi:hypothetical protein
MWADVRYRGWARMRLRGVGLAAVHLPNQGHVLNDKVLHVLGKVDPGHAALEIDQGIP